MVYIIGDKNVKLTSTWKKKQQELTSRKNQPTNHSLKYRQDRYTNILIIYHSAIFKEAFLKKKNSIKEKAERQS